MLNIKPTANERYHAKLTGMVIMFNNTRPSIALVPYDLQIDNPFRELGGLVLLALRVPPCLSNTAVDCAGE